MRSETESSAGLGWPRSLSQSNQRIVPASDMQFLAEFGEIADEAGPILETAQVQHQGLGLGPADDRRGQPAQRGGKRRKRASSPARGGRAYRQACARHGLQGE